MAVTVTEVQNPELLFKINEQSAARSRDRVHATDIIRYIGGKASLMKKYSEDSVWDLNLAANCGFLWEDVISSVLRELAACRPGELEMDGITGSPDGLTLIGDELALEEYKFTWKSSKNSIWYDWYYMTQCMAYMKLCGVNLCRFRVLYVMGNYQGGGPQHKEFLVRADQEDVDGTWRMLVKHRDEAWEWAKEKERVRAEALAEAKAKGMEEGCAA